MENNKLEFNEEILQIFAQIKAADEYNQEHLAAAQHKDSITDIIICVCCIGLAILGFAGTFWSVYNISSALFSTLGSIGGILGATCGIIIPFFKCVGAISPSSIFERYFKKHALQSVHNIVEQNEDAIIEYIDTLISQISPDSCSFKEAFALINNFLNLISAPDDLWADFVSINSKHQKLVDKMQTLVSTLFQWDSVKTFCLMLKACTEDVRDIAPTIFKQQTGKWLDEMSQALNLGELHEYPDCIWPKDVEPFLKGYQTCNREACKEHTLYSVLFARCAEQLAENSQDQIEQLTYNLKQLYPILQTRHDAKLQAGWEKAMANTLLPLNDPESDQAMENAVQYSTSSECEEAM